MRLRNAWIHDEKSSPNGESVSSSTVWRVWKNGRVGAVPAHFPPDVIVAIKALACELPSKSGVPLSRWNSMELAAQARRSGLVATISGTTIWRWLPEDAIRPWQHRCWIFPRDPQFAAKAGRILDLYERIWQGQPLREDEFVLSADEKTSIQARARQHPTLPPPPGLPMKIEHAYRRWGAGAYLAAWDVHRAQLFGRCEARNGIAPFDRLVDQVMSQPPYRQARRVFWILDNGSAHRTPGCVSRWKSKYPTLVPVHGPVHASWFNPIEIYFSILQRKLLTPHDFASLAELEARLLAFQQHYQQIARPFQWRFTRRDLANLLEKLALAASQKNTLAYL